MLFLGVRVGFFLVLWFLLMSPFFLLLPFFACTFGGVPFWEFYFSVIDKETMKKSEVAYQLCSWVLAVHHIAFHF